jgi:hypothetical protein
MSPRVRITSHRCLPARSSLKILLSMASPPVRKRSTSMKGYFFWKVSTTCLLWLKVIVVQWTKRFSFFAPSISFTSGPPCGQEAAGNKLENRMTKRHRTNVLMSANFRLFIVFTFADASWMRVWLTHLSYGFVSAAPGRFGLRRGSSVSRRQ